MKTTLSPRLSVTPEGRPDIWLPTKDSLLSYIAFKAFEQIHCFLPVNGALIGALIGADWDVESVVEEIQHPDAVVAVFTNPHTNAGHSLAIKRSNPPGLKCFDIGPITHADLEVTR